MPSSLGSSRQSMIFNGPATAAHARRVATGCIIIIFGCSRSRSTTCPSAANHPVVRSNARHAGIPLSRGPLLEFISDDGSAVLNSPAFKEVITAALLVIGGKILSGRTKDQNVGYIAEYLTALGIELKEVRVVGDEERAIIDALNALRHRFTYVFTTGGIGPTHADVTADCVAKAFGVPIDSDPRALAILHEWVETTGAEMSDARLRMTRIPQGADLILNKVSGAPGFWIGNVIVMAGVPSIMQAMLDESRGRDRDESPRERQ